MQIKKFLSRPGISFIEVLVSLSIIAILTLLFTMNINSQQQTAKQEAERIAEYLHDLMRQTDRTHTSFKIVFSNIGVSIRRLKNDGKTYNEPKAIEVSNGFNLNSENSNEIEYGNYSFSGANFGNRTIVVTRNSDNTTYKIIIYYDGRIRTQAP